MLRRRFMALLAALPCRLEAEGDHPRLFLNPAKIASLKAAITTTHADLWRAVRRRADNFVARGVPKYLESAEANDEQLWQREVANKIPLLALAAVLSGEEKYFTATVEWSMASCGYPHWGIGNEDGTGLGAGHLLFSLALVYDWLHDRLPGEARETLRRTLRQRGATLYAGAKGDLPIERSYWRLGYLTNHLWVDAAGLAAAGLALGEPETLGWFDLALEKFQRTEKALGGDGASQEGIEYWSYGVEYLLKFWDIADQHLSSPWWKNTAAYRQYLALPRNAWKEDYTVVDLADSERADGYGADHILYRLAALNRDPHAQWLATELRRAGVTNSVSQWLDLLWFDPSVAPRAPSDLPTLRHFDDLGIVSARSGWSGDESLVVFKCGPPAGHFAVDSPPSILPPGHAHPDGNHFVVFGCGEWPVRDDGYAWKDTGQHNTLLVDGKGQSGEGSAWLGLGMDPAGLRVHPRVVAARSSAALDEMAGDATVLYPTAAGLKRYLRRLYFLKPDVLIVADEIEADAPRRLELRFHTESLCEREKDGVFRARGSKSSLRIELLTPDGVEATAGDVAGRDRGGKAMPMHTVRMLSTRASWKNVVAFSWAAKGTEPVRIVRESAGVFRAGERRVEPKDF